MLKKLLLSALAVIVTTVLIPLAIFELTRPTQSTQNSQPEVTDSVSLPSLF